MGDHARGQEGGCCALLHLPLSFDCWTALVVMHHPAWNCSAVRHLAPVSAALLAVIQPMQACLRGEQQQHGLVLQQTTALLGVQAARLQPAVPHTAAGLQLETGAAAGRQPPSVGLLIQEPSFPSIAFDMQATHLDQILLNGNNIAVLVPGGRPEGSE